DPDAEADPDLRPLDVVPGARRREVTEAVHLVESLAAKPLRSLLWGPGHDVVVAEDAEPREAVHALAATAIPPLLGWFGDQDIRSLVCVAIRAHRRDVLLAKRRTRVRIEVRDAALLLRASEPSFAERGRDGDDERRHRDSDDERDRAGHC